MNYEEILEDLKNARKTIAGLRNERDLLRAKLVALEKSGKKNTEIVENTQKNNGLDRKSIGLAMEKLNDCFESVLFQSEFYESKQKVMKSLKNQEYVNVILWICDVLEEISKENLKSDSEDCPKEVVRDKGELDFSNKDYKELIGESKGLIENLDRQYLRISGISKNLMQLIENNGLHKKSSHSMADLRVPNFYHQYKEET